MSRHASVRQAYIDRIVGDVKLARPMKIVVDCGNGVAGSVAPDLFRRMGCRSRNCSARSTATSPTTTPTRPSRKTWSTCSAPVRETGAELGLAFDGDGDRLGVVTRDGEIIYPDRQLMLFAADVLTRNPGAQIIYDVKCSRWVVESIRHQGGRPLMWNTGHALIKTKLKETGAPLAGEMSGHMFFKERWFGFDDALYTAARLLEIVSRWADSQLAAEAPAQRHLDAGTQSQDAGRRAACAGGEAAPGSAKLLPGARELITIDGVRAEYADGFGLARASNTTPVVVLRFEADRLPWSASDAALARIQGQPAALRPAGSPALGQDRAGGAGNRRPHPGNRRALPGPEGTRLYAGAG
jgi:phosphomannomutase/phosphoglucomutase